MRDLIIKQTAALMSPGGGMSLYNSEGLASSKEQQEVLEAEGKDKSTEILKNILSILKKSLIVQEDMEVSLKKISDSMKPTARKESILLPTASANNFAGDQTEEARETLSIYEKQTNLLEAILGVLSEKSEEQKEKDDEKPKLGGLLAGIAVAFGALFGAISGYVKAIVKMNKALFSVFESILGFLTKKFPSIFSGLQKLLTGIENSFIGGLETIKGKFSSMAEKAVKIVDAIKDFFGGIAAKLMDSKAVKFITDVIGNITGVFKNFFGGIGKEIKVIESVASPLTNIIKGIKDSFGKFFGFFESIGKSMSSFGTIFSSVAKIVSKLTFPLTIIMSVWDTVKGAMEGYEKDGIVGLFSGAIKGLLSSIIGAPLDLLKGLTSWILEKLGFDEASKFLDSFSFDETIKTIVDAVFSPIETLKSIFTKMMGFLEELEIPEISFTIPVINKKVSIGPFRPFKKENSDKVDADKSDGATPVGNGKQAQSAQVTGTPGTSEATGTSGATAVPVLENKQPQPAVTANTAIPAAQDVNTGNNVVATSIENQVAREDKAAVQAPVMISAPSTNVQNSQNVTVPQPVRNPDMSFNRYMSRSRVIV